MPAQYQDALDALTIQPVALSNWQYLITRWATLFVQFWRIHQAHQWCFPEKDG